MSDPDPKPKSRYDELPKMRTPSGRFVYDPSRAPVHGSDPAALRRLLEEGRAAANADARAAVPEAVAAAPAEDGAIVAAGEEAAKAHADVVIQPQPLPRMPSGSVRIAEALDPRKLKTARMARPETAPASGGAKAVARLNVTTREPAARRQETQGEPRRLALPLIGAALAAVVVWALLRGLGGGSADQGAAVAGSAPAVTSSAASASTTPSAGAVEVVGTGAAMATGAASTTGAPRTTGAPSTTPHGPDPGASATPKPSTKPNAPTAPRAIPSSAPSAAPSAPPSAPATGSPPPYEDP